ncbi:hypothetical protein C8R46DRAFT_1106206 [Mycena filopes]|nr:hypothetical protein C8R46DRAFT_1106206 [Mycena filopes]
MPHIFKCPVRMGFRLLRDCREMPICHLKPFDLVPQHIQSCAATLCHFPPTPTNPQSIMPPNSLSAVDTEYYHWHGPTPDLQADAVRLCIALQGDLNPAFLSAASELRSCGKLHPAEFQKHSRKIIRLIETARDRLEAEPGISLFLFTSSPKGTTFGWRDVYFDLLRMLQQRRNDVDKALQGRANSLLVRLSSNFVGRQSVTPAARMSLPEESRRALAMGLTTCTPRPEPDPNSNSNSSTIMPPPDAFPPGSARSFRRRKRMLPFLFLAPEPAARARKRARHHREQENQSPATSSTSLPTPTSPESGSSAPNVTGARYKSPPLTRRFGIFCTAKSSMHRPWPRSVRAC